MCDVSLGSSHNSINSHLYRKYNNNSNSDNNNNNSNNGNDNENENENENTNSCLNQQQQQQQQQTLGIGNIPSTNLVPSLRRDENSYDNNKGHGHYLCPSLRRDENSYDNNKGNGGGGGGGPSSCYSNLVLRREENSYDTGNGDDNASIYYNFPGSLISSMGGFSYDDYGDDRQPYFRIYCDDDGHDNNNDNNGNNGNNGHYNQNTIVESSSNSSCSGQDNILHNNNQNHNPNNNNQNHNQNNHYNYDYNNNNNNMRSTSRNDGGIGSYEFYYNYNNHKYNNNNNNNNNHHHHHRSSNSKQLQHNNSKSSIGIGGGNSRIQELYSNDNNNNNNNNNSSVQQQHEKRSNSNHKNNNNNRMNNNNTMNNKNNNNNNNKGTNGEKKKEMRLYIVAFLLYFAVSGGAFGIEDAIASGGPLLVMIALCAAPFIWCLPEGMVCSELSCMFPDSYSGGAGWCYASFGEYWGIMQGYCRFVSAITDSAVYPILFVDLIVKILPEDYVLLNWQRHVLLTGFILLITYINYRGIHMVGKSVVLFTILSSIPYLIFSCGGFHRLQFHRLWELPKGGLLEGVKWKIFLNTMFWNFNAWDTVGPLAGDVHKPGKTMPRAMSITFLIMCLTIALPVIVGIAAFPDENYRNWDNGTFVTLAKELLGPWGTYMILIGFAISCMGLFESDLICNALMLAGMSDRGMLPSCFGIRNKYGSPILPNILCGFLPLIFQFFSFQSVIALTNQIYCICVLTSFACFLYLRKMAPDLSRPYKIPFGFTGCCLLLFSPTCFTILIFFICFDSWFMVIIFSSFIISCIIFEKLLTYVKIHKILKFENVFEDKFDYIADSINDGHNYHILSSHLHAEDGHVVDDHGDRGNSTSTNDYEERLLRLSQQSQ